MTNIRQFFKYLLYYLIAFLLILYVTSINEGMEVFGIVSYVEGIPKSFEYYLFWVLPYWLIIVFIAAVLFAFFTLSIKNFLTRS